MRRGSFLSTLIVLCVVLACTLVCGCSDDGETLAERVESGQAVQAERGTMTLDINRTIPAGTRPKGIERDTWTVLSTSVVPTLNPMAVPLRQTSPRWWVLAVAIR